MNNLKNNKVIKSVVYILSMVTIFWTVYFLILPAVTLTNGSNTQSHEIKILDCKYTNANGAINHGHDNFCYDEDGNLVCQLEEISHEHDDSCYDVIDRVLTCGMEEGSHFHDDLCFDDEGELICSEEEYSHFHDDSCYEEIKELICGAEDHQHDDSCFTLVDYEDDTENESDENTDSDNEMGGNDDTLADESVEKDSQSVTESDGSNSSQAGGNNGIQKKDPELSSKENDKEVIILEYRPLYDEDESVSGIAKIIKDTILPMSNVNAIAETEISPNAIKLEYGNNIDHITLSYKEGDNWIDVSDSDNIELPVDTAFRLGVEYSGISVADLKNSDGQLVYEGMPSWFKPEGTGVLIYDGDVVARIEAVDGKILISFDQKWLDAHNDNIVFSGYFAAEGSLDWREIANGGHDKDNIPGLDFKLNFEGDLEKKYGNIDIEKSDPVVVKGEDGKYYLKYELTVTSMETLEIPEVMVRDIFSTPDYIKGYYGVSKEPKELSFDAPVPEPWEKKSEISIAPGQLSVDDEGMLWEIGTLAPEEVRTLTYYAEIDEDYIFYVRSNPIQNKAAAYSGEYKKSDDSNYFIPKNDIKIEKSSGNVAVSNTGTGTIDYTVTITSSADNSFTLDGLTLNDAFPEGLKNYIFGEDGSKDITVTITTITSEGKTEDIRNISYNNASFVLEDLVLEPGAQINITYTIHVKNIFFVDNGEVELRNKATLSKGDRTLRTAENTQNLEKNTWVRKSVSSFLSEDKTINMLPNDGVYEYTGSEITQVQDAPGEFTVPKGSVKYQVVLNENQQWDISDAILEDVFGSEYMKYSGYIQVQLFKRSDTSGNTDQESLIGELESLDAVSSVWLEADGKGNFKFKPSELGLPQGQYTYMLTYYAKTEGMDNIGSANVRNSFTIEGTVGDGNGGFITLPKIGVSVENVVQGGLNYNAEKMGWYYEPKPVYKTDAIGTDYTEAQCDGDYAKGAIYWVIRVEGNIGAGKADGYGKKANKVTGFYIKDVPGWGSNNVPPIFRDAVVGVFAGPKNVDITSYRSFADFVDSDYGGLKKLKGNPRNDKYFHSYYQGNDAEYEWFAENIAIEGIFFPKGYELNKNEAIYIVVRAVPNQLPSGNKGILTFQNDLLIDSGAGPVKVDDATHTLAVNYALYKESKGAYDYDIKTGTFKECGGTKYNWLTNSRVNKKYLTSSGTYTAWLLNVNWNGNLSGTVDVADYLPEGMELVYTDINNYGGNVKGDPSKHPKLEYIDELQNSSEWEEIIYPGQTVTGEGADVIAYYNPSTREIRWRISNLTAGEVYDKYQMNLFIFCKVTDHELFFSGKGKEYVNKAAILESGEQVDWGSATVYINKPLDKGLSEEYFKNLGGSLSGDKLVAKVNKLPFKIEINPYGEDMIKKSDTLPALIDELSAGIELIEDEDSPVITLADGTVYKDFTYTLEEVEIDGRTRQNFIINGLPDNTPMTLTYNVRIAAKPNESVSISNKAYWAGYPAADNPQVEIHDVSYSLEGAIFANESISVKIIKVDAGSHTKKLNGAKFELYQSDENGNIIGEKIADGITDSRGMVEFKNEDLDNILDFNKIYCIKEVKAPNGYKLNNEEDNEKANCYYFVIANTISNRFDGYDWLDVWYDSAQYSVTIENQKGEIGVEKIFESSDGTQYTPTSGDYRFGLYNGDEQIEILTVRYTENGPEYYLNGVQKESPTFSKYDPDRVYQIYELDESGEPIEDGGMIMTDGQCFLVSYSDSDVTVGSDALITNRLAVSLPQSGGAGTFVYYLAGGILILLALFSLKCRNIKNRIF